MPSLLNQRSKKRRKVPPCGKLINYVQPRSPFQKLIESARLRYGLSTRALALAVKTSQSNIWIWLHNENGYPSPKSFKEAHLMAMSKTLNIPDKEIRSAIDASRSLYNPGEIAAPVPTLDALGSLIQILENDKRVRLLRSYVLNLAKNLHAGALASGRPASSPE